MNKQTKLFLLKMELNSGTPMTTEEIYKRRLEIEAEE